MECERIIGSIEHFYGHLEIESVGHLGLTSIEYKADVESRKQDITSADRYHIRGIHLYDYA